MIADLRVTFRDVPSSPAVEAAVRERAEKLERFHDKITSCHVVVASPHRHQQKGKLYDVRIDLAVPGGEVVVNREPGKQTAHEDVYVAIRDAFEAARRQLQDHSRRRRGEIKTHEHEPTGRVTKLFPDGFGFIESEDGREIYFHRNSVLEGFEQLSVGTEVHFKEEQGANGPQASTLSILSRKHL